MMFAEQTWMYKETKSSVVIWEVGGGNITA